jgi:hypothetical protein
LVKPLSDSLPGERRWNHVRVDPIPLTPGKWTPRVFETGVSVAYTPELRAEAVGLYRIGGRGTRVTAHQIGVALATLRKWVHHAQVDEGLEDGLTSEDRLELRRLRREVVEIG